MQSTTKRKRPFTRVSTSYTRTPQTTGLPSLRASLCAKRADEQGPGPIPAYKMALAGSIAGGVAGIIGNPAELMMVRMQADKAKPPESEFGIIDPWSMVES